jgi:uncharacterized protein YbjT (DUF2867 family)
MAANPRTASLLGATGLVGRAILQLLLADLRFGSIHIFVRRSAAVTHPKLVEHVIDFDAAERWQPLVTGDVLFSALGTTLSTAGSEAAQYRVDHTYQFQAAKAARQNGASTYVLISSAWASPQSRIFYTRMKGELERDTEALNFPHTRILRPGPLDGDRHDRPGERVTVVALRALSPLLPSVLRPSPVPAVARVAVAAAFEPAPGTLRYEPKDIVRVGAER